MDKAKYDLFLYNPEVANIFFFDGYQGDYKSCGATGLIDHFVASAWVPEERIFTNMDIRAGFPKAKVMTDEALVALILNLLNSGIRNAIIAFDEFDRLFGANMSNSRAVHKIMSILNQMRKLDITVIIIGHDPQDLAVGARNKISKQVLCKRNKKENTLTYTIYDYRSDRKKCYTRYNMTDLFQMYDHEQTYSDDIADLLDDIIKKDHENSKKKGKSPVFTG